MLIPAFFLNCVVAIGGIASVNAPGAAPRQEWQTTGTGFFYGYLVKDEADPKKREYEIYLVTARHVVENRGNLKIRVNPQAAGKSGQDFEIPTNPNPGEGTWFFHPDKTIDVAAVRVNFNELNKQGFAVDFFAADQHSLLRSQMQAEQTSAGDGIFVLGFPMNLAGQQRNYVIVRQGAIARISEMLDNASTTFMLDAFVFPGNSGGPIVTRPEAVAIDGTKAQNRASLIGVVIAARTYVDTAISQQTGKARVSFEENAGLAEVLPIDYVDATITAFRTAQGLPEPQPRAPEAAK